MPMTRRQLVWGGAGLSAALAVPAVQHMAWGRRDFVRPNYDPFAPDLPDRASWMNWSGSQRATPVAIDFPDSEANLADLVAGTPHRIRPVGSGHSFSALVPSAGRIVDVSALSGLYGYDPATGEARFGAGTRLFEVARSLNELGRALPNLPDIDVQTLAGSFATGTHGTGNRLSALHDYVTAFRMVTARGEILDINAEQAPDLFQAGKVSLGALGLMTEFTLKTVPAFRLRRQMTIEPVGPFLERIEALGEAHRNFEFFYSPGTGLVAWLVHDIAEGPVTDRDESEDEDFLAGLKDLRDTFGWFPWLRRQIAGMAFPRGTVEDVVDDSFALLSTTRPTRFNEMEYHLPRAEGVATLRRVIAMLDRRQDAFFPLEYRHVAADSAWLSPFQGGPRASIAIHAAVDEHFDYFFDAFEPVYRAVGGRPHWGKLNRLDQAGAASLYPDFNRFRALRRDLDPDGKFLNPYLASLFGEAFDA